MQNFKPTPLKKKNFVGYDLGHCRPLWRHSEKLINGHCRSRECDGYCDRRLIELYNKRKYFTTCVFSDTSNTILDNTKLKSN